MRKTKVYIIDDSLIFRAMLETMVSEHPVFEICRIAASADEAREDIVWRLPDIVLLDLKMPGTHGLDFLDEISEIQHAMQVVIISAETVQGSEACEIAFERGAAACFDKARVIRSGRDLIELMHDLGRHRPLDMHLTCRAISLPSVSYI